MQKEDRRRTWWVCTGGKGASVQDSDPTEVLPALEELRTKNTH